jgi:hypothetical protein
VVTVKIKPFAYNMLERYAKGGQFVSESYYKDGHYHIEVDDAVYRKLLEIDPDINLSILWLVIKKIKESKK